MIITGSNASLLSGEFSTVLTGRHLSVELFPFSYQEFLKVKPGKKLEQYLKEGGFPEPLKIDDGQQLLRQYYDDIIERDIREYLNARSSQPIRKLVKMVFEAAGSELSLRRISGALEMAVDTASSYLDACESAYLLFPCPYFAFSAKKQASRNKKYYPIDPGLRNTVITQTGADLGKSLECAVYTCLRKQFGEVCYWRNKGEVDFVVNGSKGITPVQVTWSGIQERHEVALEDFYSNFPHAQEAVVITAETFSGGISEI